MVTERFSVFRVRLDPATGSKTALYDASAANLVPISSQPLHRPGLS
jgi:hypothetical protein